MKSIFYKILISFFAVLIALVFIEFLLIILKVDNRKLIKIKYLKEDWRSHHMFNDILFVPDPILLWKPNPKLKYVSKKGFLGDEFDIKKDETTLRIFCLGDSLTQWLPTCNYPAMLKELLAKQDKIGEFSNFEVINAGAYGYTSYQGIKLLEQISNYHPDIVIFLFGWNDAVETYNPSDKYLGMKIKNCSKIKLHLVMTLYRFRFYHLIRNFWLSIKFKKAKNQISTRVSLKDYKENLIYLKKLSKKYKFLPILVTRPYKLYQNPAGNWRDNVYKYNKTVREFSRKEDIILFDAYDFLKDKKDVFYDECHLNEKGLKLLSREIYFIILKNLSNIKGS